VLRGRDTGLGKDRGVFQEYLQEWRKREVEEKQRVFGMKSCFYHMDAVLGFSSDTKKCICIPDVAPDEDADNFEGG
jgi:hypothetical protein